MSSNNSLIGDWQDWFPLHYAAMSHKNGARRRRRREAATARRAQVGDATLTDDQRAFRDSAIDRARSRHAAVAMRLEKGFRWLGGAIGGNPLYARPAAVHPGLVSDDAAILKLFVTKVPRAAGLQTGHTKRLVDGTDSKLLALDCAYVVVNGRMRGVLRVEVDAILASWQEIPTACQAAGLHPPNVAVGYVDARGRVINPHLLWIIERSVAFIGSTRTPQQRLFDGVLRGLTAALIPLGADPGGLSNPLRMKNPVSPLWDREIFAQNPYTLTELCGHVDLYGNAAELQVQRPKGRQSVPDHPAAEIAVQSNQPFRELAAWARQNVDRFRGAGIPLPTFQDAVEDEALRIYRELDSTSHRIERRARNTAQSVARWTWQNYHCRKLASRPAITADVLRVRQAAAGSATAAKCRASTEAAILEAASLRDGAHTVGPHRRNRKVRAHYSALLAASRCPCHGSGRKSAE